ncbi:hypothetical protein MMC97_14590 [Clostridioides difficile]|nr:hypothetical protein [Clostridioides difficile]MCH7241679.1 hypothetical protein [Clostridioides difficile]MCI4293300.1 hypothetical protein [Clostridioides difficile]MCM4097643.1 hypothetical protein [Clostridioides difficile]MCW0803340.1 hypothetical protein [Clostridioides difficile]MDB9635776.1 hypothetical protein [Clostridioides difficile]
MNKSRNFKVEIFQEGVEKGIAKGKREEKFNIIIKLKNKGYNLSEICDIIDDLNKSEVEKIYNQN